MLICGKANLSDSLLKMKDLLIFGTFRSIISHVEMTKSKLTYVGAVICKMEMKMIRISTYRHNIEKYL